MRRQIMRHSKGSAAVLAMIYLVLIVTLSLAMFSVATTNVDSASNLSYGNALPILPVPKPACT